ncbi:DUF2079 domain-containing protein [Actinomadura rayongensis]|uniref:DUF2079 domain-containing protein n=1 Tax=Actinomadura rayongensis TaxID=1429076 RepID=A0A6I4W5E3_9ACTN|nr:DUF2079 domain-containing protein [Actinomadura rayongensis]
MAEAFTVGERRAARSGRTPRASRPRPALVALVAGAAVVYTVYALLRLRTFRTTTYDLVIFDQAVRSYSRFGAPVAPVKGVHNGFGPDFSILGDHFSPLLAVLAPFYRLHDGPATLLTAQAVLFALAIVPVFLFAARRVGERAAYAVAAAYALSWPVAEALAFDFHEVAFVPLLSALMIERWDAGRRGQAVLAAAALLLAKEDMGLLVAGFGLVLLTRRGERRAGALFAGCGLAATWVASRVLIAEFGGDNAYYWAYGRLGDDLPGVARHAVTRPWDFVLALGAPPEKLATMGLLVLPFLLLPLLSPLTLAVVPLLAERMLADRFENWWEPHYHYNAFLVAVLALAAADGAARLRDRAGPRWNGRAVFGGILGVTCALVPVFGFKKLAEPSLYVRDARGAAAARAVAHVPAGVEVEAANHLGPALTGRARVLLWDQVPRGAEWVAADVGAHEFPFGSVERQRERVRALRDAGYREVYRDGGFVILRGDAAARERMAPWKEIPTHFAFSDR